jgi:uncharacterized membrane protein YphA (DoxX/SURF4 family)
MFLIANVIAMSVSSFMIIVRKHSEYAVMGLFGVVITQALGYGLIFDLNFFLRNLSVMGGLLMVLSDSWVRKRFAPAGLPTLDEKDRKMYFQLAGRVLLIFLFVGFVFAGEWSFGRVVVILLGAVACVMVVVGFKAKWSAVMLVVILSVFNLLVNNFWTVSFDFLPLLCSCLHLANLGRKHSFITITPTRTLLSTISSKSCRLLVVFSSWSTWVLVNSVSTRRRRSTRLYLFTHNPAKRKIRWTEHRLSRISIQETSGIVFLFSVNSMKEKREYRHLNEKKGGARPLP